MSPINIFIVDDHPLVREWLGQRVRTEPDIEMTGEAAEPASALAGMTAHPPDVAVVDLLLLGGSGIDLIREIRARLPGSRVLVLSMLDEIADVMSAFEAGAHGYVMKSGPTADIVTAIRRVHGGGIYAGESILGQLAKRAAGRSWRGARAIADALSERELEVFRLIGAGYSNRRIATEFGVSLNTIQTYCARIKEKLCLADAGELTIAAIRWHDADSPEV